MNKFENIDELKELLTELVALGLLDEVRDVQTNEVSYAITELGKLELEFQN